MTLSLSSQGITPPHPLSHCVIEVHVSGRRPTLDIEFLKTRNSLTYFCILGTQTHSKCTIDTCWDMFYLQEPQQDFWSGQLGCLAHGDSCPVETNTWCRSLGAQWGALVLSSLPCFPLILTWQFMKVPCLQALFFFLHLFMLHNTKLGFMNSYFNNTLCQTPVISYSYLLQIYMCHRLNFLPVTALDLVKYKKRTTKWVESHIFQFLHTKRFLWYLCL